MEVELPPAARVDYTIESAPRYAQHVVALTGGFALDLATFRISSKSPWNPFLIAFASGFAAWALPRVVRRAESGRELAWRLLPAIAIAIVGAGLQVFHWALARPMWLDEEMIAINVRERALMDLAGPLWLGQSAPFGWLVVQRVVLLTLGDSERALRLVPLLFGLATLPTAVWVGRRWAGGVGAALLALLCTFGQWVSHYSIELKHYSADIFLALLIPALAAARLERKVQSTTTTEAGR